MGSAAGGWKNGGMPEGPSGREDDAIESVVRLLRCSNGRILLFLIDFVNHPPDTGVTPPAQKPPADCLNRPFSRVRGVASHGFRFSLAFPLTDFRSPEFFLSLHPYSRFHEAFFEMSEHIHYVTDDNFATEVLQSQQPVLVDYWAEWCGPCKMIAPILDEVAKEYAGKLKVAKLNIDDNQKTPAQYGIRGIPTLMLFKGGNVEATKVGALSKGQLTAFIDSNL